MLRYHVINIRRMETVNITSQCQHKICTFKLVESYSIFVHNVYILHGHEQIVKTGFFSPMFKTLHSLHLTQLSVA